MSWPRNGAKFTGNGANRVNTGAKRTRNDTQRVDNGAKRTRNDTKRVDNGAKRTRNGTKRVNNGAKFTRNVRTRLATALLHADAHRQTDDNASTEAINQRIQPTHFPGCSSAVSAIVLT